MSIAITVDQSYSTFDKTLRTTIVRGTLTLSGNYGTGSSHGDTLSFGGTAGVLANNPPVRVFIYEQPVPGTQPSWYSAVYQKAAVPTIANGAVSFALAGTEYSEGTAYSGVIASAVWRFEAIFETAL